MSFNNLSLSTADLLAKRMAPDLSCQSCKALGLRTDGVSKGRLRLICPGCRRSSYADMHPRVQFELDNKCDVVQTRIVANGATGRRGSTPVKSNGQLKRRPSDVARSPTSSHVGKVATPRHVERMPTSYHVAKSPTYAHEEERPRYPYVERSPTHAEDDQFPALRSSNANTAESYYEPSLSEHTYNVDNVSVNEDVLMAEHMGAEAMHTLEMAETIASITCDVESLKKTMFDNTKVITTLTNTNRRSMNELTEVKSTLQMILEKIESFSQQLAHDPRPNMQSSNKMSPTMLHHEGMYQSSLHHQEMSQRPLHQPAMYQSPLHHDMSRTLLHQDMYQPSLHQPSRTETWSEVTRRGAFKPSVAHRKTAPQQVEANRFRDLAESIPS